MSYAEGTQVSPERSQLEIASLIRKYGATSFATGWQGSKAVVGFVAHGRQIRFVLESRLSDEILGRSPEMKIHYRDGWHQ